MTGVSTGERDMTVLLEVEVEVEVEVQEQVCDGCVYVTRGAQ